MIVLDKEGELVKWLESFDEWALWDEKIEAVKTSEFSKLEIVTRKEMLWLDVESMKENISNFAIINTFSVVVAFIRNPTEEIFNWWELQLLQLPKVIVSFRGPLDSLSWQELKNLTRWHHESVADQLSLQKNLVEFSSELENVMLTAQEEMKKARELHQLLVPSRRQELKGMKFAMKYSAGEVGGAEYVDMIVDQNPSVIVMISTNSYLASSSFMGILQQYKNSKWNTQEFLKAIQAEVKNLKSMRKKALESHVLVLEVNSKSLIFDCYGWGDAEYFSQEGLKRFFEQESSSHDISNKQIKWKAGDKGLILSPGFLYNWRESEISPKIDVFLLEEERNRFNETLMNLFFKLKQSKTSHFSTKDSTVLLMEVDSHALYQV